MRRGAERPSVGIPKGKADTAFPFFIVRPAGRTHLEVQVLYGP